MNDRDSELWRKVTADVRPLKAPRGPAPPLTRLRFHPRPVEPAPPKPSRPHLPVLDATLDGMWDRKLRQGRVAPDMTVDLHGYSQAHGYEVLAQSLSRAARAGCRAMLVITGKGREGQGSVLKSALPNWVEQPALRPYIAALRPAHPKHGGGGAWYVILRRLRSPAP